MKTLFLILSTFLLLATPTTTVASGMFTAQAPDLLIYQGDTLALFANPLEPYLEAKGERTLNNFELPLTSTACYRGYQATWELVDRKLYLVSVRRGCMGDKVEYFHLEAEFGSNKAFADWVNGTLISPQGKLIHYIHSGYQSLYERELNLYFERGILQKEVEYDNSRSYQSVFSKDPDSLNRFIESQINWDQVPNLKDRRERITLIVSAGANRKIDSVSIVRGSDIEFLNQEALRIVKLLPEWDVHYVKGRLFRYFQTFSILFSEKQRKK